MKKLNSLVILLTCTVLVSGCATDLEIKQAENEPLCWGNINAKSAKYEGFLLGNNGYIPTAQGDWVWGALGLSWYFSSKIAHGIAATVNPNCYSDKSDSNSSDTPDSNSGEYNRDGIAPNPNN